MPRPARRSGNIATRRRPPAWTSAEGAGPHATPLIVGNRLFAVGSRREFFALDKTTGKVLWSHDLIKEYGAPEVDRGMANSPLLFNNTIILPIGGRGQALGAFNPDTGALLWKAGDVEYSPASPIADRRRRPEAGRAVRRRSHRRAWIPPNGTTLWNHPHRTDWGLNISTPVWSPSDHLLLFSSAYGTGSRALELRQAGGKTTVAEKLGASTACACTSARIIRIGDIAYMSSGDFGPAFLTAVNVKTGAIAWQDRAFARAQLLYADGKLIVLDEDGTLGARHGVGAGPQGAGARADSREPARGRRRRWSATPSTFAIARPSRPTISAESSSKPRSYFERAEVWRSAHGVRWLDSASPAEAT